MWACEIVREFSSIAPQTLFSRSTVRVVRAVVVPFAKSAGSVDRVVTGNTQ
jgi:hypothetical protein